MSKTTFLSLSCCIALTILLVYTSSCSKHSPDNPGNKPDTTKPTTPVTPTAPPKKWIVSTLAGSTSGFQDGDSTHAQFKNPQYIWADNHGSVFVSDAGNFSIRQVTYAGHVTTYVGNTTNTPDPVFGNIFGLVGDSLGNLYDIDYDWVRKISSPTNVSVFAGALALDFVDGTGTNARFMMLMTLSIDRKGNIFLTDYDRSNNAHVRKITPAGVVTTLLLNDNTGFPGNSNGSLWYNYLTAPDPFGNLYFTSTYNAIIKKMDPSGNVTVFAGTGSMGNHDGKGSNAVFGEIRGMVCDSIGNLFICDGINQTIRKATPDGTVTTIAGIGSSVGTTDGDSSKAMFYYPTGITIDKTGTLFVVDNGNNRIRKLEYK